ncbi:MAG: diaminopimelate epimerase [Pseudomonadales bacterium]
MILQFTKMHGLGNDFVVIDLVTQSATLSEPLIKHIADRRRGVGFDQLLVIGPPTALDADFFYQIYNSDGSESNQCGNGARCVAKFIFDKQLSCKKSLVLQTQTGRMTTERVDRSWFRVDIGIPSFMPEAIPFEPKAGATAPFHCELEHLGHSPFGVVNLGNPHAVLLVNELDSLDVSSAARDFRAKTAFKEGVNVGFMEKSSSGTIKLRVDERGVGETSACGSGACAAVAIGQDLAQLDEQVTVSMPGGKLEVSWKGPDHSVWLSGPAEKVFDGKIKVNGQQ